MNIKDLCKIMAGAALIVVLVIIVLPSAYAIDPAAHTTWGDVADHGLDLLSGFPLPIQVLVILWLVGGTFAIGWLWVRRSTMRSDLSVMMAAHTEMTTCLHGIASDLSDLRSQFTDHIMRCPAVSRLHVHRGEQ